MTLHRIFHGSPGLNPKFSQKKKAVSLSCRSLLPSKVDHWRRSGDMENLLEMCGISAAFAATFAENMWSFLGFCWRQMGDLSNKKPRIMWVKQSYNKPSRSHHLIGGICLPFPGKWLVYLRHCFTHKNGIDQQRWPARLRSGMILHGTGGFHQRNRVAFPHGIQMYTVISANRYHCDFRPR